MRNLVNLCDVCDFQGGSQPPKEQWIDEEKDGYIRMLQIRDFTQADRVKPEYVKISPNIKTCCEDDILIARYGASVGKILTGLSGAYNVAIMKTIPDENMLNKRYLYYYLLSDVFQNAILNVGSRAAQAGFNKTDLQEIRISCPNLGKQEEICRILDRVCTLLSIGKYQLEMLDELVSSRFIEMFGNPVKNTKNWKKGTVANITEEIISGQCLNGEARKKFSGEKAVLKVSAVTYGYFKDDEYKVLKNQEQIKKNVYPQKGDLLFSRANTKEYVGATALVLKDYPDLLLPDKLWKLVLKDSVNPVFIKNFLSMSEVRDILSGVATGTSGSMYNISMEKLRELDVIIPPLELQNQFAAFVHQTDKSKLAVKQSLEKLETLKKALMQQYFGQEQ